MGHIPLPDHAGARSRRRSDAKEPKKRRALTNVGGKVDVEASNEADNELLRRALDVRADDPYVNGHVHGFHSYPARLHPRTAQRLVAGLSRDGDAILDPFCGSGTVLVEALVAGRAVFGLDANPLATALSSLKLHRTDAGQRQRVLTFAKGVAEAADARRLAKAGPVRRHGRAEVGEFEPHVFLELDGLQWAIGQIPDPFCRSALRLVLSSLLNKVSRRASDTNTGTSRQRWASGFVIRFFLRKTQELLARMGELERMLPQGVRDCRIELGDARHLPFAAHSVAAVVTSPPYPGIYDYVEHHRLRLTWLGLSARHLEQHEIGAKRSARKHDPQSFRAEFNGQLQRCLAEMARVLLPHGTVALILADSVIGSTPWYADEEVGRLAYDAGLVLMSQASQPRHHFHEPTSRAFSTRPRCERLLLLRRRNTTRPHTEKGISGAIQFAPKRAR